MTECTEMSGLKHTPVQRQPPSSEAAWALSNKKQSGGTRYSIVP